MDFQGMNHLGLELERDLSPQNGRRGCSKTLARPTLIDCRCLRCLATSNAAWQDRGLTWGVVRSTGRQKKISGFVLGARWTESCLVCEQGSEAARKPGRIHYGGCWALMLPEGRDLPRGIVTLEAVSSSNSRFCCLSVFQMHIYMLLHWRKMA